MSRSFFRCYNYVDILLFQRRVSVFFFFTCVFFSSHLTNKLYNSIESFLFDSSRGPAFPTRLHVRLEKTQTACAFWSESSKGTLWVAMDPSLDGQWRRLSACADVKADLSIWVFAGLTCYLVGYAVLRLIFTPGHSTFYKTNWAPNEDSKLPMHPHTYKRLSLKEMLCPEKKLIKSRDRQTSTVLSGKFWTTQRNSEYFGGITITTCAYYSSFWF